MKHFNAIGALLLAFIYFGAASATTHRSTLTVTSLRSETSPQGLLNNQLFEENGTSLRAEPLNGELRFDGFTMTSDPEVIWEDGIRFEKDVQLFPSLAMEFFTDQSGHLISPVSSDLQAPASGESYWSILWSVGKIWREAGDNGWSRALIPFALIHPIDGETRNGFLTFVYRNGHISNYQMQIVENTSIWIVPSFMAWGKGRASLIPKPASHYSGRRAEFSNLRSQRIPILPWSKLERLYGVHDIEGFMPTDKILANGLYCPACNAGKPAIFMKECRTPTGRLPMCEEARFGNWSVGKSMLASLSYHALAKVVGTKALKNARVKDVYADYMHLAPPKRPGFVGWDGVTLEHLLNMASGIGDGSWSNYDIDDGYSYHGDDPFDCEDWPYCENFNRVSEVYNQWYEAFSLDEKLTRMFSDSPYYPWGPGVKTNYRDQDTFLAGSMMNRIFQKHFRTERALWDFVQTDVLNRIGTGVIPVARTLESRRSNSTPIWAWGMFPTIEESIKISRLFQNRGYHRGTELLASRLVIETLRAGETGQALTTKITFGEREVLYHGTFWQIPYHSETKGCDLYIPTMLGWGGNKIVLLPNGMIGYQIANHDNESEAQENLSVIEFARAAERIGGFSCP